VKFFARPPGEIALIGFHQNSPLPDAIANMDFERVDADSSHVRNGQANGSDSDGQPAPVQRTTQPMALPRPSFALPAILFALWLGMMLFGGPHGAADAALAGLFRGEALVPAARLLTRLGDWPVLLPLTAVGAAALCFAASARRALLFAAIVLSGRLLVELQKIELARARPDAAGRLVHVSSLSFPSAHAAYSMMTWLALALLLAPPARRTLAVAAALLLAFAVGLTRLVLHVHWPSDVIGGWAFGAAWTLLLVRLAAGTARPRGHRPEPEQVNAPRFNET